VKVVFLQELHPDAVAYLREKLPEFELVFPQTEDEARLVEAARGADVVVGYRIPKGLLEVAPRLRAFLTGAAGVHHSVAESLRGRPQVQVANSHANSLDVAEYGVALALASAKLIVRGDREMRRGDWSLRYDDVPGVLVTGKTAVIVGYGSIGRAIAKLLKGFEMRFIGVRSPRSQPQRDDLGVECVPAADLRRVLASADFVFVAAPLTPATRGLIGKPEFDVMKRSAILVHLSRGPVVDEKSLFDALKSKGIAGAALDVWYAYPQTPADAKNTFPGHLPFHELDNIVMSPHRASYTERMHREQWDDVVENIRRLAGGKPVKNPVNLEAGY
jgi:phosphoglycerate dehydrogenase-like enzyme